ncbi:MAG: glucans biosynthesis protein [Verrucomicrobia bacterium]|nr:MAG: glucans biosynthesis protein [Verrucomicrobiota bacterium]TAE85864.1 MAG: glucans biosynthesis protein [Verrucomicrobiota bacterium]TAF27385.1 MAG: glucans biosynthesis protein [Verrucomicrobiota bacterium]TAF42324.1 MAG: glucans biosynthesis protein [Verrucomicrobiota bacterium]
MIARRPLTTALALGLLCHLPLRAADSSFDQLRERARQLASKPYAPKPSELDDFWKNLSYDQHRDIRFKMESGLWWEQGPFSIDFFHPGWTAKKTVSLFEVSGPSEKALTFDASLFDYGKQKIPASIPAPPGYAGWRARTRLNSPDYMDEFLVFLGASYFRAIPAGAPYGLSARGLSINSGLPGVPEEFPDFTEFHLEKPAKNAKSLVAHALLEGESVAGAYQFTVTPGPETTIDIEAEITLRRPVQQLGLAPFSSMFWFGENTHPRPYDFRPEVHDSDGLLMELGSGNLHYRPLEHSHHQFRHCVFTLENPRSWSLIQRDRSFAHYQDPEARYHDRPSVTVEPLSGFEHGKLHLIEMPTDDETDDNVILVWEPGKAPQIGKPFHFHYRLKWQRDPSPSGLFAVKATRAGNPVQKPDEVLMTIDFAKPLAPEKKVGDPKWDDISKLKPVVTVNQPGVKVLHVGLTDLSMPNVDDLPAGLGRSKDLHMPQVLRAFFVIDPTKDIHDIDMTCELQDSSGKAVSERWIYLWKRSH